MGVTTKAQLAAWVAEAPDSTTAEHTDAILAAWATGAPDRLTAFKEAFEMVVQVIKALERARGQSPREVRNDGNLGEAVATASSAARDGLRLLANAEQGRPG